LITTISIFGQSINDGFLEDFEAKYTSAPQSEQADKPTTAPTVTVTFNASDTIGRVSKYIYGNNANGYMTQMVDQPALIDYISKLAPNIIRFPGGNISSIYFWNAAGSTPPGAPDSLVDGSGKKSQAGYWYGKNTGSWTLSLDNFYSMLDMTGSTGMITINYGFARYGTSTDPVATAAHYAAEWVRYDGGRTKFWEIGNESFGSWQAGYRIDISKNKDGQPALQTGALYGQHFKVFVDSMRKAAAEMDSPIYIGAQLYEQSGGSDAEPTWNAGYFGNAGDAADFYIVHSYFTPYNTNSNAAAVLSSGTTVPLAIKNYIKAQTTKYNAQIKPLALTEWNIFAVGSKQSCSFVNGMLSAIVLGELAKNGFSMSSRWDLANGYDSGNDHGMFSQGDEPDGVPKWNPRPVFFYMYYFQQCFGDHIISSSVSGSSNVLAYASKFKSGHAGIVVVNKGTSDQVISLNPSNYGVGSNYYIYSLTGGTDNGEFSQSVYVNNEGPSNANGGPIDALTDIPASAYPTEGGIVFNSPARSVQYILVEPGTQTDVKDEIAGTVPDNFILNQNYPNPFNPSTVISYSIPVGTRLGVFVQLKIYDILGREVTTLVNKEQSAGKYQVKFDGSKLGNGVYFYTIKAGDFVKTNKMILMK
jgi:hypothetical protein